MKKEGEIRDYSSEEKAKSNKSSYLLCRRGSAGRMKRVGRGNDTSLNITFCSDLTFEVLVAHMEGKRQGGRKRGKS